MEIALSIVCSLLLVAVIWLLLERDKHENRIRVLEEKNGRQSMIFAKRGDFVWIPENLEITGIGIYERNGDELKLVNKKFVEDISPNLNKKP